MDYFVWAPDLDPRMSDAICEPLRLQRIELSAAPSEKRTPDAVIVAWSSRDRLSDRLHEQGWVDGISPTEVYLADLSEYMSLCLTDMDALAAVVLLPRPPRRLRGGHTLCAAPSRPVHAAGGASGGVEPGR